MCITCNVKTRVVDQLIDHIFYLYIVQSIVQCTPKHNTTKDRGE